MHRPDQLAEHARKQHGLVARLQALAAGLSPSAISRRLTSEQWEAVAPRVYRLASSPRSEVQRVLAQVLSLGPGAMASHRTAAWLWGLDGFKNPPRVIELSADRGKHCQRPGVRIHTRRGGLEEGFTHRFGVPVTLLARTVLDLASGLPIEALESVLDSAGRNNPDFFRELDEFLSGMSSKGRQGAGVLWQLVALRRGTLATGSGFETAVLQRVRREGLVAPTPQYEILDEGRVLPLARGDLVWPKHRVLLHADGLSFHKSKRRFELDAAQRSRLTALGWRQLVVTPSQVDEHPWLEALKTLVPRAQLSLLAGNEVAPRPRFPPVRLPPSGTGSKSALTARRRPTHH